MHERQSMNLPKNLIHLDLKKPEVCDGQTPHTHGGEAGESEHFVQFYEDDAFLVESVGTFIGAGLGAGNGALVIATQAHREALEERLEAQGLDLKAVKQRGQYVSLDAVETLSKFMVNRLPDENLFIQVMGGLVAETAKGRRGLRAFGEMVALLWAGGNGTAAIRLEELWNDLGKKHAFSLFCAYPMNGFKGEANGEPFLHICREHTRVIPAESYTQKARTDDERLRTIAFLQQKAGSLEAEILERKRAEAELGKSRDELREQAFNLEQEVAERTAQLREKVAELEAFSYSISHDMRSPLRAMQGFAKTLLQDHGPKLEAEAVTYLQQIHRASNRLDLLVQDVLGYSRIVNGQMELQAVELGPLVEDILNQRPDFEAFKHCITVERPLHTVIGHEACLSQCLTNLIANGLKFVKPGMVPAVRVGSDSLGDKVRVWVRDNGVGIHPEHHGRIFKIFGRVYSEKLYEGTGIGLAIVKKAVGRMGGETGFRSELDEGSEFWFVLSNASPGQ